MQSLKNKVALITGGTKGIGFGIAQALLAEDMRVCVTGRSGESVDGGVKLLSQDGRGGRVMGAVADVRSFEDQERVVRECIRQWKGIDVLVANAGVGHFGPIDELTLEQWDETIDTNLTGVFYSVKACLEALKASTGYIITVSSLAGTNFFAGGSAYNASKFGLTGFTQAVMLDLRKYGIKTTTIMPGSVSTYFNNHTPGDDDAWKIQVEDLGQMVADLLRMHPRTLPSKIEVRPTQTSSS